MLPFVIQVGNSRGIRLPKIILDKFSVKDNINRGKKIQNFMPEINAYSPLNFHKKIYGNRTVLYCIRNTSSLGAAIEKRMLAVVDAIFMQAHISLPCLLSIAYDPIMYCPFFFIEA